MYVMGLSTVLQQIEVGYMERKQQEEWGINSISSTPWLFFPHTPIHLQVRDPPPYIPIAARPPLQLERHEGSPRPGIGKEDVTNQNVLSQKHAHAPNFCMYCKSTCCNTKMY